MYPQNVTIWEYKPNIFLLAPPAALFYTQIFIVVALPVIAMVTLHYIKSYLEWPTV